MNERENDDTLLKSNVLIKISLDILKLVLYSSICLIPIMLIAVLFYNGKAPSISINISLLFGSLIIIKKEFKSFKNIGLSSNNIIKNIAYGLILCSLYYYFELGIEFMFGYNLTIKLISNLELLGFLSKFAIIAVGEEILFRGFLLKKLREYTKSYKKSVIIQAVLFAIIHIVNPSYDSLMMFIYAFIIGITLGILSVKQESLWCAISFHTLFNFTGCILILNNNVISVLPSLLIIIFLIYKFMPINKIQSKRDCDF